MRGGAAVLGLATIRANYCDNVRRSMHIVSYVHTSQPFAERTGRHSSCLAPARV